VDYIHKPFSPPVRPGARANAFESTENRALRDDCDPGVRGSNLRKKSVAPQRFENVAVVFVDLVSCASFCDRHTPEEVVGSLGDIFVVFEACASRNGLEKIKTIDDAFLATAGLLRPVPDPLAGRVLWPHDGGRREPYQFDVLAIRLMWRLA
jgi:class 3 adenylate cyclase